MSARRPYPTRLHGAALAAALALLAAAGGAGAQEAPRALPYAVPESPAFTFLGASPTQVARPSAAGDLALALLSAVDSAGQLRTGLALSGAVWPFLGVDIPLDAYRADRWKYVLANTLVSVGTAPVAGDPAATDLALGLRATLVDRGDPMLDPQVPRVLQDALLSCMPSHPPSGGSGAAAREACFREAVEERAAQFMADRWNAASLTLGLAAGERLRRSRLDEGDFLGAAAWLSGGVPLGRRGQLLGQLRYDHRRPAAGEEARNSVAFGVRAVAGSPRFNLFLEGTGTTLLDPPTPVDGSEREWSGGIEFLLTETLWLSTGFGSRFPEPGEDDTVVFLLDLRWVVSEGARLR